MKPLVVDYRVLCLLSSLTSFAIFSYYICKQVLHNLFEIPNIGVTTTEANWASIFVIFCTIPSFSILFVICRKFRNHNIRAVPNLNSVFYDEHKQKGINFFVFINLLFTSLLFLYCFYKNGSQMFSDTYKNRLDIEHGIVGLTTIMFTPTVLASIIISGYRNSRIGRICAWILAITWGYVFSKGFFLAYPLLVSFMVGKRLTYKNVIRIIIFGTILTAAVVYLGLLRSGATITETQLSKGIEFMLLLTLHRIDQLDGLAVLISSDFGYSWLDEVLNSIVYLIPRTFLEAKPVSFSVEMTQIFRPDVVANGGANNFSIFGQFFAIFSWNSIIFLNLFFFGYMLFNAVFVTYFLKDQKVRQLYLLSVVFPYTLSLISAGLFREYFLLQITYGLSLIPLFKLIEKNIKA